MTEPIYNYDAESDALSISFALREYATGILTGFEHMPLDFRDLVLDILRQSPVQDILTISAYTPNLIETTPIIVLQPLALAASAL